MISVLIGAGQWIVHNCTIFLCSLEVRNIVQGGDPLYAVFFLHRALEAILDQNEYVFFAKNKCLGCEPEKKNKFW